MVCSLESYHTLRLRADCLSLRPFDSLHSLQDALEYPSSWSDAIVLGSGSNVVLPNFHHGAVLVNKMKGVVVQSECDDYVELCVSAGEDWHELVIGCLNRSYYGLENLAWIPGTVGAAPIQNIGAYGVELADFFVCAHVWDRWQRKTVVLSHSECLFGYRTSVFKTDAKGRYVIISVTLRLSKKPRCCLTYPRLKKFLDTHNLAVTPENVCEAVMAIRKKRLPDWRKIATVGSFFINPVLSSEAARFLMLKQPGLNAISVDRSRMKFFAGELLRVTGWFGFVDQNFFLSPINPIVLIHNGGSTRAKLERFVADAIGSVKRQLGVKLQVEPEFFLEKCP